MLSYEVTSEHLLSHDARNWPDFQTSVPVPLYSQVTSQKFSSFLDNSLTMQPDTVMKVKQPKSKNMLRRIQVVFATLKVHLKS